MASTPKHVLIRCDAAPETGFGHVVRCLALADELRDRHGCQIDFAMLQGPQGVAQVQTQGYAVYTPEYQSDGLDEDRWLQDLVAKGRHQVLVLDVRTRLSCTAVQSIRESGVLVVTIDDPSERRLAADLAFYPPVPQVQRLDWTGFTGELFVGWDWVLLRPQFAQAARKARASMSKEKPQSQREDQRRTVLVSMGGSDPAGLTLMALEALEQLDINLRVLVVIGGGFMHETALHERLHTAKLQYEIYRNVTDMASLMAKADLAVASFGVTAYELAAMHVPTIYLCLTEDHALSACAFVSEGLGTSFGHYADLTLETLISAMNEFLQSFHAGQLLFARPEIYPDGLGVERISKQLVCHVPVCAKVI